MGVPTLVPLTVYFAVQRLPQETLAGVAEVVLVASKGVGVLYRHLEALGAFTVGSLEFNRFRSDMGDIEAPKVLGFLFGLGRVVIGRLSTGEYELRSPSGRVASISNLVIHMAAKPGETRMYRGTRIKRWEEQFPKN